MIHLDGSVLHTITAATRPAGWDWSWTPGSGWSQELHSLYVVSRDAAQLATQSDTIGFTVDDTNPPAPEVSFIGGRSYPPASGTMWVNVSRPSIMGVATGDTTKVRVVLSGGASPITMDSLVAEGKWAVSPPDALLDSAGSPSYTLTITAFDAAGNSAPAAGTISFAVDTTAPSVPGVSTPGNGSLQTDVVASIGGGGLAAEDELEVEINGVISMGTVTRTLTWSFALPSPRPTALMW